MQGADWRKLAKLDDLRPVLDRSDTLGAKNRIVDLIHRRALANQLPIESSGVTLDFGSGVGRLSGWLAERSGRVIGLEVTPEMVAIARRRVTSPNVSWALFDGDRIPVASGSVRRVLSVYVLQHVIGGDRLRSLAFELARVVTPGGRLVMIEQVRQDQPKELDGLEQRLASTYTSAFEAAGFRAEAAEPIRVPSRIATALSKVGMSEALLLRVSDASLAWARWTRRLGHADYLMTFDKPET